MGQFNSLDDILGVLRRRFVLILGITLIGAALSLVYATSLPRSYEASATIQIELSDLANSTSGQSTGNRAKYRLNLIKQQLMARQSLLDVIDALGLFADTPMSDSKKVDALRKAVTIEQILDPADAWRPDAVPSGLTITVRLGDPEAAARVANTFLDLIVRQSEERRQAQAHQALSFFEKEAARVEAKISALEAEIADFKQQNAQVMPDGISALRTQLATLNNTELEIERQLIGLKANAGRVREDVLTRQIEDLEVQRDLVKGRIADIEAALATAPEVEREYARLTRELTQLQEQLGAITRRRADAEMEQALEANQVSERFEVLERALVPEYPVSPSRKKIALAGTALFFLAGAALAILLEMLNPAIRTAAQMERELGIAPIVAIPVIESGGRASRWRGKWAWIGLALAAAAAVIWALAGRVAAMVNGWGARTGTGRPPQAPAE